MDTNHLLIWYAAAIVAAAKLLQSCPTLCDPIDGSPPGSPIPGILQARTLEWVAISFSSAWKWKGKVKSLSRVRLLATPWTAAYQTPPSVGFSRQEYWSGVPSPSPHFPCVWQNKDFLSSADMRCGQAQGLDIAAVSTRRSLPILLSITSTESKYQTWPLSKTDWGVMWETHQSLSFAWILFKRREGKKEH